MTDASDQPQPPLPRVEGHASWFWTGGEHGELRLGYCEPCGKWLHPAVELCPYCLLPATYRPASGKARVVAITHNEQRWLPNFPPPYIIAIVAMAEDEDIRLTTNLVGPGAADLDNGAPVRVVFAQHNDVWLPRFEADAAAERSSALLPGLPVIPAIPAVHASRPEKRVIISGIGSSAIGRKLPFGPLALAVDACRSAIADAGLRAADIDGICAYPGSEGLPGMSQGGVRVVEQALRINPVWHAGANEGPGQISAVLSGMLAVASGLCRHVLCFTGFSARPPAPVAAADGRVDGEAAWSMPYGCVSPANWLALYASNYCARYRVDPEFLGNIVAASRAHAARNPLALHRDPFDLDQYRASRIISAPLRLADCDMPCDGAKAVIVSARETARDLRNPPVRVLAMGTRMAELQSWDQGTLAIQPQVSGSAAHLWSRTELRPRDVDVALLYDGFTFNLVSWLEALGFCGPGEAVDFIGDGTRIGPKGKLPVNTDGGHLSAGRSNGYGQLLEAVLQLRGQAGPRQVAQAQVAVVSSGGAIPAGSLLLHAW